MPRLTDADELLSEFLRRYTEREKIGKLVFVACEIKQDFADMLQEFPTIEAEPEKHGRWVDIYGGKYDNHLYECSECKGKALYYYAAGQLLSDYCPHCGARIALSRINGG